MNKIKAKHSTKKLYEFIGGQGIHICTKLDQNFAVLEFFIHSGGWVDGHVINELDKTERDWKE